jgi:surface protein
MHAMFMSNSVANPDVSNWITTSIDNLSYMFNSTSSANPDVSNWDVSNVIDMRRMFQNATVANPNMRNWDVSSVTDMSTMLPNSNLSVENLTACYENWSQLTLKQNVEFGAGTTKYNTSGQAGRDILVNTYNWTITDGGLVSPFIIEVDTANTGVSNSDQFQFTGAEGDYDVVAKQNDIVVATFNDLSNQETITLPSSGVYVLEVIPKEVNGFNRIQFNFGGDNLKITDIKQWGTIVWSSFERAFRGCENMLVTATDVPNLSNVNSMSIMFSDCLIANPDTSNWDVSSVTTMSFMFRRMYLANPDVSNWNVGNVTTTRQMFFDMDLANPDISNWDVGSATDMRSMTTLTPNFSTDILTACYENWSQLQLQQNVSFSAGNTKYNSSGQAGRDILVNTYNWTITDGGQV